MSSLQLLLLAVLGGMLPTGDAFSFGAPASTCWTMYPKHHGTYAQTGPSPFLISVAPDVYMPGEDITLTISNPKGTLFRGIQIGAHRQTGNKEEIVGRFVAFPGNKVRIFTCAGGYKNMATHWNNNPVPSISLTWKAPSVNVGNITFRATIVEHYESYWHDVEASLTAGANESIVDSLIEVIPMKPLVEDVDFSQCGDTKGCFLYPRHCSGSDCVAAVAFQYRPKTNDYLIEMSSSSADDYLSVAFSHDKDMGHDETYTCVSQSGIMDIQHGYNPEYYNERLLTMFVSETEIRHVDGEIQCRFVIPQTSEVREVFQDAPSLQYNTTFYNHTVRWYLQLAWGEAMPGTDVITYHREMPAQTDDMVDLKKTVVYRGSAYDTLVQAHAAVMTIAWVLLAGLVTVVSRHFKDWRPEDRCCGTKIWFQVHRELAMLIVLLTGIGLAVIFAKYGSGIREFSKPHSLVGLAVTACVGLQVIAGFLRPDASHKLRVIFNWGHLFLGQVTHLLAGVTMFLAFDIEYINKDMRAFGFISLGIWVAVQVIWHIAFEVLSRRREKKQNPESYAINEGDKKFQMSETERKETGISTETLLMAIYFITLSALCVAVMLAFLLF